MPTEFDFSEDAREPDLLASELCFAYGVYQSERIGTVNKNKVIVVNFKEEIVAVMRKETTRISWFFNEITDVQLKEDVLALTIVAASAEHIFFGQSLQDIKTLTSILQNIAAKRVVVEAQEQLDRRVVYCGRAIKGLNETYLVLSVGKLFVFGASVASISDANKALPRNVVELSNATPTLSKDGKSFLLKYCRGGTQNMTIGLPSPELCEFVHSALLRSKERAGAATSAAECGSAKRYELKLELSCTNLANKDFMGKSDPYVVVLEYSDQTGEWREIGVTEVQLNELNPKFKASIAVQCAASDISPLRFEVYDDDSGGKADKNKRDLIGRATITKFAIVDAAQTGNRILHSTLSNENGHSQGKLHVKVVGDVPADASTSNRVLVSIGLKTVSIPKGALAAMGLTEADSMQIEVDMAGQQSVDLINEGRKSSKFETVAIPLTALMSADWQCDVSFWCDGRTDHEVQFKLKKYDVEKKAAGPILVHGWSLVANTVTTESRTIKLLKGDLKDGMLDKDLSALRAAEASTLNVEISVAQNEKCRTALMDNVYTKFDADGDGMIDLGELTTLLTVRATALAALRHWKQQLFSCALSAAGMRVRFLVQSSGGAGRGGMYASLVCVDAPI